VVRQGYILYCINLYVDDILLLSPSVSNLQKLLLACEDELEYLHININIRKSCPRNDKLCANITTKMGLKSHG